MVVIGRSNRMILVGVNALKIFQSHILHQIKIWLKKNYAEQQETYILWTGVYISSLAPLVSRQTVSETKRIQAVGFSGNSFFKSESNSFVYECFCLLESKKERKMKTFRTVAGRLFKTWQWVMIPGDDETFCYAAGFIALCAGTQTFRGISTSSPHCRNSTTENLFISYAELRILGLSLEGKSTDRGCLASSENART